MSELNPVEVSRLLADAFEAADVPYAVGGAIAYGYFGPPRGTQDADFNVFLGPSDAGRALDALEGAGLRFDRSEAEARISEGAHVRGFLERTPVDVFFDSIPLHDAAAERVVTRPLAGRPAQILSAEDTVVFKLLFYRGKDRVDVERLVGLVGHELDREYVRRWLVECVGEHDHRVDEWDELVAQLLTGSGGPP